MLDEKMVEDLNKVFYNKKFLAGDLSKFWKAVEGMGYDYGDVKKYYNSQEIVQINRPYTLKPESQGKITTDEPFKKFYLDTMYFGKYGFALINGIDLFTRKGYYGTFNWKYNTEKGISSSDATRAFSKWYKEIKKDGFDIDVVITDHGSEFKGEFSKFLKEQKIIHVLNDEGDHSQMGIIERYNGTIRNLIEKYKEIYGGNLKNAVPIVVETYNETKHRTLGYAPDTVYENPKKFMKILNKGGKERNVKQLIKVGSEVRILLRSVDDVFSKKGANWSKEIYPVDEYDNKRGKYLVNKKYYRDNQLQVIDGPVYRYDGKKAKVVEEAPRKRGIPRQEKILAEISDFNKAPTEKRVLRSSNKK